MDEELLNKMHAVEAAILEDFDVYCRSHDIRYSLYAGTMLGAVRHGGFIPWDDDIDVAMTRDQYSKFKEQFSAKPLDGYYFESYETDGDCGTCHGKLRKLGTVFLQEGDIEGVGHHEIWIDIFPLDKCPLGKSGNRIRRYGKQIVLLVRANVDRITDTLSIRLVRSVMRLIPKRFRQSLLVSRTRLLEDCCNRLVDDYEWLSMSTIDNIDNIKFPMHICKEYSQLTFEGHSYMSFSCYEEMLKIMYGNYLELPPIEERICTHNPIKVTI